MNKFWIRNELINTFLLENNKVNLSAIRKEDDVYTKHILDSIELNKIFDINKWYNIIDIWTWWGFPLLPLAISNPNSHFTGLDSVRKKINSIQNMVQNLQIKNVTTIWSRSEDHYWQYDILTARAMWYIDILFKNWLHLIKSNGYMILYKMFTEQENNEIYRLAKKHYIKIELLHKYKLFDNDIQRIIYLLKIPYKNF